ncbi:MAG: hypothetical protein QOG54_868 [Actinomycetota bacterium]|nr:hypothetical protein [Actinomycetota bacterium]
MNRKSRRRSNDAIPHLGLLKCGRKGNAEEIRGTIRVARVVDDLVGDDRERGKGRAKEAQGRGDGCNPTHYWIFRACLKVRAQEKRSAFASGSMTPNFAIHESRKSRLVGMGALRSKRRMSMPLS